MIFRENGRKPVAALALLLSFIFSLLLLQRRHDLSLPINVNKITHTLKKPTTAAKGIAPLDTKQIKLPEASIKALLNETLGVRPPAGPFERRLILIA